MAEKPFSRAIRFISLNSAIVGITMSLTLVFAFATLYMRSVIHVSNFLVGVAISMSHLISVIMSPIAGRTSDRARTPWGRRRPFILVGALLSGLFLALIGLIHSYPLFVLVLGLFFVFSVMYQVPFYALIPEEAPEGQRGLYTVYTGLLRFVGFALIMAFGSALWSKDPAWPFFITAFFVVATALITVFSVKEHEHPPAERKAGDLRVVARTALYIRHLGSHRKIIIFFTSQFFWWVGLGSLIPFATIMMKEYYHVDVSRLFEISPLAIIAGTILAISVIGAGILGDKWGHRQVITLGLILVAIASLLAIFVHSIYAAYAMAALLAVGVSPLLNEPLAMLAELIPKGREGEFYGLDTISITLSQVPAALLGGAIIDWLGFSAIFVVVVVCVIIAIGFMTIPYLTGME